jgi:hypothetical protein
MSLSLVRYFVLLLGIAAITCAAASPDPEIFRKLVREDIFEVRSEIQRALPSKIGDLDKKIVLKMPPSDGLSPGSSHPNGIPTITIPLIFIDQMTNITRMSASRAGFDCVGAYKTYQEVNFSVDPPEVYLNAKRAQCPSGSQLFPMSQTGEYFAARELKATLVFAYLHEMGHLYHGHVRPAFPAEVESQLGKCQYQSAVNTMRLLEFEADEFAVATMFALNRQRELLYILTFWSLPSPQSGSKGMVLDVFANEGFSTHPVTLFRWVAIIKSYRSKLKDKDPLEAQVLELMREAEGLATRAQQQLPPITVPRELCRK